MGLPGSECCHPHLIDRMRQSWYLSTIPYNRVLLYQSEARLREVLGPFLGSGGVMTHEKKTPFKRRAIERHGFVGAFIVLPKGVFAASAARTILPRWLPVSSVRPLLVTSCPSPTDANHSGVRSQYEEFGSIASGASALMACDVSHLVFLSLDTMRDDATASGARSIVQDFPFNQECIVCLTVVGVVGRDDQFFGVS